MFSIVTVVLNGKSDIERTMSSVWSQGSPSLEYILIDGGSTDGTIDIIKKHKDKITRWISEPDRGISDAFNKGIRLARGEFVGILNSGDWYEPDTISHVAKALTKNAAVDVFCGAIQFWESNDPTLQCESQPESIHREMSVYHPTVFIRKSAYERFGLYDTRYRYAMDYELLLRFAQQGARFHAIPQKLSNMRLEGESFLHWREGLEEVRRARSIYFAPSNVWYYHRRAVLMNYVARFLKRAGLRGLYNAYWDTRQWSRNRRRRPQE
jgi:glycosyltransferase involved in cell wall biosynthesis